MPRRTARDRQHSVSRESVLRALERNGPTTVARLARATGLHENTVRGHLARLESDGYAKREPETRHGGKGRPTVQWNAVGPEALGPYAGLAAALADALAHASDGAVALAQEAGQRWGEELASAKEGARDPRAEIIGIMREQGFAPEEAANGGIALTRCPMLAVATQRPDIVCAVHAGMLEGIAGGSDDTDARTKLLPFATPDTCQIRLSLAL